MVLATWQAGDRSANAQTVFGHGYDLLRGVDADLLEQGTDEILENFAVAGQARFLQD